MAKRKIFDELMEGVDAMTQHRKGKLTLRSYKEEVRPLPAVDSKFIRETRKRMRCSRAVFARKLRINERTLEKWEQGRAKSNPQAARFTPTSTQTTVLGQARSASISRDSASAYGRAADRAFGQRA